MHVKREISTSNMNSMSDSIKRLAISHDGHPIPQHTSHEKTPPLGLALEVPGPEDIRHILTVMSNAKDDFMSRYDIVKEIGKGGFSTVYHCRRKGSTEDYAVKVIDLRPLRLREKFNPTRLKREVDIMRKLKHPNIVQFIEVYEDTDYLMMVLEYCPGKELFDVILERKCFTEEDARPIFSQISKALFYLHSMNIIHRDIKPENILIHKDRDAVTGDPVAKLLDFGLSKNAGVGGSMAKTFVGTPCYLAPEVEHTSKGLGGTYGLPADCWSLGAVLYVMLVARFPEFERDFSGKVVVKLPASLWGRISDDAKDLVRSLMNTNQHARIGMANVLKHPWMGKYQLSQQSVEKLNLSTYFVGRTIQEEEDRFYEEQQKAAAMSTPKKGRVDDSVEMTANGTEIHHQAMVIRTNASSKGRGGPTNDDKQLPLAPLLHLQRDIAICFEEAHDAYVDFPEVASQVRKGATLCREQLRVSTKMLIKVEQTAAAVLEMFPDLQLAVEESEPALAAQLFGTVKDWVSELKELVHSTQSANKASMDQIQEIVESSTFNLQASTKKRASNTITMPKSMLTVMLANLKINDKQLQIDNGTAAGGDEESIELDANQILELFVSLFGVQTNQTSPTGSSKPDNRVSSIDSETSMDLDRKNTASPLDISQLRGDVKSPELGRDRGNSGTIDINSDKHKTRSGTIDISKLPNDGSTVSFGSSNSTLTSNNTSELPPPPHVFTPVSQQQARAITYGTHEEAQAMDGSMSARSPKAATKLAEALSKLRQVDMILEQLSVFWANTEVVLDLLTKKGQHVEQFIGFATKPKLMARFKERIVEYERFWEGVRLMSSNYISGVSTTNPHAEESGAGSSFSSNPQNMYGFLDGSVNEGTFRNPSDVTPPRSTFNRYETTTPPTNVRVEEANSFDSLGGVFKTVPTLATRM